MDFNTVLSICQPYSALLGLTQGYAGLTPRSFNVVVSRWGIFLKKKSRPLSSRTRVVGSGVACLCHRDLWSRLRGGGESTSGWRRGRAEKVAFDVKQELRLLLQMHPFPIGGQKDASRSSPDSGLCSSTSAARNSSHLSASRPGHPKAQGSFRCVGGHDCGRGSAFFPRTSRPSTVPYFTHSVGVDQVALRSELRRPSVGARGTASRRSGRRRTSYPKTRTYPKA